MLTNTTAPVNVRRARDAARANFVSQNFVIALKNLIKTVQRLI